MKKINSEVPKSELSPRSLEIANVISIIKDSFARIKDAPVT
jgi:hypothetical protein